MSMKMSFTESELPLRNAKQVAVFTLPKRKLSPVVLNDLHERGRELIVLLSKVREAEKYEWIMTPGGPGKIWDFLPGGQVGVGLRSDILSKPEGERPVRFYPTESTACLRSQDLRKPSKRTEPETRSELHATTPEEGYSDE